MILSKTIWKKPQHDFYTQESIFEGIIAMGITKLQCQQRKQIQGFIIQINSVDKYIKYSIVHLNHVVTEVNSVSLDCSSTTGTTSLAQSLTFETNKIYLTLDDPIWIIDN